MEPIKIQIPVEYKPLFSTDWRHLLIHGGRFSLKSHTTARALLLRARSTKLRVLCAREFQNSIDDSSLKLLTDLIQLYGFTDYVVTKTSIENTVTGSDFLFKGLRNNSQSIKSIEGIDIAWVEEAQTITRESIEILTPTVRKPGSQMIWTFNRLTELDPVYEMFALKPRNDVQVLYLNYPIAEKYGWLPKEIKDEIEYDQENNPELYQHKWLGQPISQTSNSIIPRLGLMEAMNRDIVVEGAEEIGVDIARMGKDRSVFWKRKGLKTVSTEQHTKLSLTDLADRLETFANYQKATLLKLDDSGVGGGLTDIMKQRGYNVLAINFGQKPVDSDKYPNYISEAWFHLQGIMDTVQLPLDKDLLQELSTRQFKMDTKGRRVVESKDDYKKRGYRSPDLADACILAYYTPQYPIMDWAAPVF